MRGFLLFIMIISTSTFAIVLNDPYPASEENEKIYYTSFSEQPKTLDPAKSYSANEYQFLGQIYEPPLEYDYLKRPYTLKPLTSAKMPDVRFYDAQGNEVTEKSNNIAYTVYTIQIRPGIYYAPHPAFAKNSDGSYSYYPLSPDYIDDNDINTLADFPKKGTRELLASDYVYQIKRLASPKVNSPIYGLMGEHIEGFFDYAKHLPKDDKQFVDLRQYPLSGVRAIDDYTYEITLKGRYTQFLYWQAMPFFAPIPWEVDRFYNQEGMDDVNLGLDWYPVGTGPFYLTENNPNSQMVMSKNPNFREEYFPNTGSERDKKQGFLKHSGEKLPLINKAIYTLEKEAIPRWNKFMQGYYDLSGISADSFDQAIEITADNKAKLTDTLKNRGIKLKTMSEPSIFYLGFNMLDKTVGGDSQRARLLRQAIAIAINYEEYIAIFLNGRGYTAFGPIPPGIFGSKEGRLGINPYVYKWQSGKPVRHSIRYAHKLMAKAGYKGGIDQKTHKRLILNYDVPATPGPDNKSQLDWMRKQFAKLGISLNVRATQYNRFQEKMRTGNAQIFYWGWNADYPDPENFLFLLYGSNGKVKYGGENAANYQNSLFDKLFNEMKNLPNNEKRQKVIDKMVEIVRYDSPWVWGINPESLVLSQSWMSDVKPNTISQNTLKYIAVDVDLRNKLRQKWNQPVLWPFGVLFILFLIFFLPFLYAYKKKRKAKARRRDI